MSPAVDARTALARLPLLAGATDDDLDRIEALATPTHREAGTLLLRTGDPADRAHLLLTGRVALTFHVPGRGDLVTETLGAGDLVGISWVRPAQRGGSRRPRRARDRRPDLRR